MVAAGAVIASEAEWADARVRQGIPLDGVDMNQENIPLEAVMEHYRREKANRDLGRSSRPSPAGATS